MESVRDCQRADRVIISLHDFQQLSVIWPIGGDQFPLAPPAIMNVRKGEEWILVDVGSLDREQVKTTNSNYEQLSTWKPQSIATVACARSELNLPSISIHVYSWLYVGRKRQNEQRRACIHPSIHPSIRRSSLHQILEGQTPCSRYGFFLSFFLFLPDRSLVWTN